MKTEMLVLLTLAGGPLTVTEIVKQLGAILPAPYLSWENIRAYLITLNARGYIGVTSDGKLAITAGGARFLLTDPHLSFCVAQLVKLWSGDAGELCEQEKMQRDRMTWVALSDLVRANLLVPDAGQPPDVSDRLCERPAPDPLSALQR